MNRYNTCYLGGLSSYSLVLMIVAFFQHKYQSPCDCNAQPTAILLRNFFQFYGYEFDYNSKVISVTNGGQFHDRQVKGWSNPTLPLSLSIEDPNHPENVTPSLPFIYFLHHILFPFHFPAKYPFRLLNPN